MGFLFAKCIDVRAYSLNLASSPMVLNLSALLNLYFGVDFEVWK